MRARPWFLGVLGLGVSLFMALEVGAQGSYARSAGGWTLLTWQTQLPVDEGREFRLRAVVINTEDTPLDAPGMACTWRLDTSVELDAVDSTCGSVNGLLQPGDSTWLDVRGQVPEGSILTRVVLRSSAGDLLNSSEVIGDSSVSESERPIHYFPLRVPTIRLPVVVRLAVPGESREEYSGVEHVVSDVLRMRGLVPVPASPEAARRMSSTWPALGVDLVVRGNRSELGVCWMEHIPEATWSCPDRSLAVLSPLMLGAELARRVGEVVERRHGRP